ncbi:MAG: glycosyltransferase family 4 protein [Bacteroidota bacterium]|nr:glycosyltransferase family 4 protein [Bacteroidota bacterium]
MSGKTLWYISQYAVPVKYGFGTRHFYLGKEFVKKGMDVFVIASSYNKFFESAKVFPNDPDTYNFEEIDNVKVCWIKGHRYKKNEGLGRIFSWLVFTWRLFFLPVEKFKKPDVIILSSLSLPPILVAYYFKLRFKAKLIFEIRDIWPQTLIDVGNYSTKNPFVLFLGALEKFGYKKADHITATMPAADLHISKRINKPFKFTCIPQGIDLDLFKNKLQLEDEFIDKYIPKGKFVIGYAGTIGKSNALDTIVNAVLDLEKENPNIHLVFLGEGPLKSELIERIGPSNNITFAPKVKKEMVGSFLHHCDLLYDSVKSVPLYNYGLSRNKWMDYMYSGKPMLVSYSGYLSLINEANCGVVVPSEDKVSLIKAIKDFYKMDKEELTAMGKRGNEFVLKNRTFDVLAEKYMSIF